MENVGETDLSAQQDRAQAPSWFSLPYGHCRWPQGDRRASCAWSQAPVRLRFSPAAGQPDDKMTTDAPAGSAENPSLPRRLRRRREFLRAAKDGVRASGRLFTIQMVAQDEAADPSAVDAQPRFGLTVTKKVAGAVGRNRIRRRLREALRAGGVSAGVTGPDVTRLDAAKLGPARLGAARLGATAGQDYVIIARREALNASFAEIVSQMAEGFVRLQDRRTARGRRNQTERTGVPRDE